MSDNQSTANDSMKVECDVCRVEKEIGKDRHIVLCVNQDCSAKGKSILRPLSYDEKYLRFFCVCRGREIYARIHRDTSIVACTCGREYTIPDAIVEVRNQQLIYGVDYKLSLMAEVDGMREELKKVKEESEELRQEAEEFEEESERKKERSEAVIKEFEATIARLGQKKDEQAREITQLRKSLDFAQKNQKTAEGKVATLSAEIEKMKKQNMEHELKNKVLEKMLDKKNAKQGSSLFGCFRSSRSNDS